MSNLLNKMETFKFFENPALTANRNNELNEYRKIGKFTDLTLKSTDEQTITVHKIILVISCPYFKGLFNSDLIETRQELIQLVDDVTIADLEILVEYIYTGKAKVSLENAENLSIKSQYFQLWELQEFCLEMLIENIQIENCLKYWRNSVKCLNDNLKIKCVKFIKSNCKSFLETNVLNLTAEEFKQITAEENLIIEAVDLYKFVVRWIKEDFETRNIHIMELIKYLDFMQISDEFIDTEIMVDEILPKNLEFSRKMVRITFQKLQDVKKQLKTSVKRNSIYLITKGGIYKLNLNALQWIKQFSFEKEIPKHFAAIAFKDEIFISGGEPNQNATSYSNFESWNTLSHKINKLPKMIESRNSHKLIDFKGKIYCCGGRSNNGSTEVFDLENSIWTKGSDMNEYKYCFSLITSDNSIYAFGGWNNQIKKSRSNIVEQFDSREGNWRIISSDTPSSSSAVLLPNNSVYCFSNIFGGKIFDLRTNKWTDSLSEVFDKKEGMTYFYKCCDTVEFNNEIFGIFQTNDNKTWGTYKFDHNANKWTNLNISLNLSEYADVILCVSFD